MGGCGASSEQGVPNGWRTVTLGEGVAFAVPPDAVVAAGQAVDSEAGVHTGEGYRITHDLGEFGESLDDHADSAGYTAARRPLAGRMAEEVTFVPDDESYAWARVLKMELDGGRSLVLRVSCDSASRCALADEVFGSIRIRAS